MADRELTDRLGAMEGLGEAIERENVNLRRLLHALTTMDMKLEQVLAYYPKQYQEDRSVLPDEHREELILFAQDRLGEVLQDRKQVLSQLVERMRQSLALYDEE